MLFVMFQVWQGTPEINPQVFLPQHGNEATFSCFPFFELSVTEFQMPGSNKGNECLFNNTQIKKRADKEHSYCRIIFPEIGKSFTSCKDLKAEIEECKGKLDETVIGENKHKVETTSQKTIVAFLKQILLPVLGDDHLFFYFMPDHLTNKKHKLMTHFSPTQSALIFFISLKKFHKHYE